MRLKPFGKINTIAHPPPLRGWAAVRASIGDWDERRARLSLAAIATLLIHAEKKTPSPTWKALSLSSPKPCLFPLWCIATPLGDQDWAVFGVSADAGSCIRPKLKPESCCPA